MAKALELRCFPRTRQPRLPELIAKPDRCHSVTLSAQRGRLWQTSKHQNMKQSKRLQLAAEEAVVAAGCDHKSVETDASEATKCRRTSSAIQAACSPTT